MDGRPYPFGRGQGDVQRVLADHPDRRHGHLDRAAAIMGAAEDQVGFDLVALDDVLVGELGQQPDFPAVLQGTGSLILHALAQQSIRKGESLGILHHPVAVCDNAQDPVVRIPDVGLIAGDQIAGSSHNGSLDHIPVQPGHLQCIFGIEGRFHTDAKAVPGGFPDIEHGFDICGHIIPLLPVEPPAR